VTDVTIPHPRPMQIEDPVLGVLRQPGGYLGSYTGEVVVGRRRITIDLFPHALANKAILARARKVVGDLDALAAKGAAAAADALEDLANDWRRQAGQRATTAKALASKLKLLAVVLDDEHVRLEFDDGDSFRGHRVKALLTPRGRFISADI
jgi:hypothetical protein